MRGQRSAHNPAGTGRELDHVLRNACLMHQLDRQRGNQRRLAGRFCDDGIACSQRRRHQAGEDGKWEIPRRNARDHPPAVQSELVLLPGGSRKRQRLGELTSRFGRVETQEIDRLAHFEHAVDQGFPGLPSAEREEFFRVRLIEVGRPLEHFRPSFAAKRIPADLRGIRGSNHPIDLGSCRLEGRPYRDPMIVGRYDRPALALPNARFRDPAARFERLQSLEQRLAH